MAASVVAAVAAAWVLGHSGNPSSSARHLAGTEAYLPGVSADLYLPGPAATPTQAGVVRAPVVVLIPGGGWRTADRRSLAPLAEALAADGMVVVNATYRSADDGVHFPTPVQDVACAIGFAVSRARQKGITPGPVVVVGHSSGAQLAALAVLAGRQFPSDCPYPPVLVDGLVGLAGAYDIEALADVAFSLFGATPGERPDLWRKGDPATWVGERTGPRPLAFLFAHGAADKVLSTTFTTSFADKVRRAGHPVRVVIVPQADHDTVYRPDVIEPTIRDWVRAGFTDGR